MPTAKASPLSGIRKQAAAHHRSQATASAGSAFTSIIRKNQELRDGFKRKCDDLDGNEQEIFSEPSSKRVKKATPKKKTAKPKKTVPKKPVVESWRPAGGDRPTKRRKAEKITDTLNLARVSTWRAAGFQEAAEKLLEEHGQACEEVTTSDLVHGGESVTHISMRFRSELVAETVKEKIDGEVIEGRKLQIKYA